MSIETVLIEVIPTYSQLLEHNDRIFCVDFVRVDDLDPAQVTFGLTFGIGKEMQRDFVA